MWKDPQGKEKTSLHVSALSHKRLCSILSVDTHRHTHILSHTSISGSSFHHTYSCNPLSICPTSPLPKIAQVVRYDKNSRHAVRRQKLKIPVCLFVALQDLYIHGLVGWYRRQEPSVMLIGTVYKATPH